MTGDGAGGDRVLLAPTPLTGAVMPALHVAERLVRRGHRVWFLSTAEHRARIRAVGAEFVELAAVAPYPTGHREVSRGLAVIETSIRSIHIRPLATQYPQVTTLVDDLRIEVVLCDFLMIAALVQGLRDEAIRPGVVVLGLNSLTLTGPDTAPYGLAKPPLAGPLNRVRNRLLHTLSHVVLRRVTREMSAELRRVSGLRYRGELMDGPLIADAIAQLGIAEFEYPRRELDPRVRFVGPPPPKRWTDHLPSWWSDAETRPIVIVTQGTVQNEDYREAILPAIEALADEDVLLVVSTGGRAVDTVEAAHGRPLPTNVRVTRFLPYDMALPQASAMITTGGFGGVQHALRFGLPVVVAGLGEDQREVGARVDWAGVGIALPTDLPTAEQLHDAVRRVLRERRYRDASIRMASRIAETSPGHDIADMVASLAADRRHTRDVLGTR